MGLPTYDLGLSDGPGWRSPDFEAVDDPLQLAEPGPPRRLQFMAAAWSGAPGPLKFCGAHQTAVAAEHGRRALVPPVGFYAIPDHVLGAGGFLLRHGRYFWQADCLPNYFRDAFTDPAGPPSVWLHGLRRADASIVRLDEPVAVVTHPNFVYGHFLLEMLPKLWLLDQLRRMGAPVRVALTKHMPEWMAPLLALYLTDEMIVWYDSEREIISAPHFVVPTLMADTEYFLHPAFNLAADDFRRRALGSAKMQDRSAPRLYLSRRRLASGSLTSFANGEEAERLMQERGFRIVHPEDLGITEQMQLYGAANCIAGEYGSALHNALFAPRGAEVIAINQLNPLQSRIAALRGQDLGIVVPREGFRPRLNGPPPRIEPFTVDLDALSAFVGAPLPPRLPGGPSIVELDDAKRVAGTGTFGQTETISRVPFLHAEPVDTAASPFGSAFFDPAFQTYEVDALRCVALREAVIIGADGLVVFEGSVVHDTTRALEAWRPESGVASVTADGSVTLRRSLRPMRREGGHLFVGFAGNWRNYAHFILETLPRFGIFRWLSGQIAGVRIVLPRFAENSPQHRSVRLLGLSEGEIAWIGDDEPISAEAVWCVSGLDIWRPPRVVAQVAAALGKAVPRDDRPVAERIYLRRGTGTRVMASYEALRPVLDKFGLQTLVAQDLSLDDQIRAFRAAHVVVGETSAGLANLSFCAPGTFVIELFNPGFVQPANWTLASLCGLQYGFLVGDHVPTPGLETPSQNSAYRIDPGQLESGLRGMGLSPAT